MPSCWNFWIIICSIMASTIYPTIYTSNIWISINCTIYCYNISCRCSICYISYYSSNVTSCCFNLNILSSYSNTCIFLRSKNSSNIIWILSFTIHYAIKYICFLLVWCTRYSSYIISISNNFYIFCFTFS